MASNPLNDLLAALQGDGADRAALIAAYLAEHGQDLAAVEDGALDAFNAVYREGEAPTADELAVMEATTSLLEQVRTVRAEQDAASAAAADRAAELAGKARPAAVETAPEDVAEEAVTEDVVPEPVAASGTRLPLPATGRSAVARLARDDQGGDSPWTITASADIRGIPAGAPLAGMKELAEAVERRSRSLLSLGAGVKQRVPIATLSLKRDEGLVLSREGMDREVVNHAANERRLQGGSLTAAGAWCAPSETIYTLCPDLATTEGLVDIPSITVTRGGIKYPQSPDFDAVYDTLDSGTWEWNDLGTNDPKPCAEIPCPDFDECRLTAVGLCIQTDILVNNSWPELTQDWTERLQVAFQHKINATILSKMEKAATAVNFAGTAPAPYQAGGTSSILDIIELQALYLRNKHRMSLAATFEAKLPTWALGFMRADLAKRVGVDYLDVSNERLTAYMRLRGINPQFVYDWNGLPTDAAPSAWPTTIPILLYPAGTFVLARQDVITLDAVYDSTLLADNKYTGLFTEEAICLVERCYEALYLTIDACPDGVTSLPAEYTCPVV